MENPNNFQTCFGIGKRIISGSSISPPDSLAVNRLMFKTCLDLNKRVNRFATCTHF